LLAGAAALAQDGKQAFATRCSVCHGVDGRGAERGPNLANNRRVRSRSLEELRTVVRNGIPAAGMPAFDLPKPS
jgi:alcohol dehydrogenase (cytochrome c)